MKKVIRKIVFAIGVIAGLAITATLILCLVFYFATTDEYHITTDPAEYTEVITGEKWGLSEEIFPKDVDGLNVVEFKHVYYDPWDANYLAYLVVDYSEKDYKEEISRLIEYGKRDYIGNYGVTGFSEYDLLAMENDGYHGFVYAITDGKSKIIYVEMIFCNGFMDIDYEDQIPSGYLPDGFYAKCE